MKMLSKYMARLLIPLSTELPPTFGTLKLLQEAHLDRIPFENTIQHGVIHNPVSLNITNTAYKVLDESRGGFCFELNGLFASLLQEIGFDVNLASAHVFPFDDGDLPTHIIVVVTIDGVRYFCDVGFGEPPLHPLLLDDEKEQVTPEGMVSKIVRDGDVMSLYWNKAGDWKQRLVWNYKDTLTSVLLESLHDNLQVVLQPDSIFSRKLIACRLTRETKYTLAGKKFKVTDRRNEKDPTIRLVESNEDAREILRDFFYQPMESTEGLDLQQSNAAQASIWSEF